MFYPYPIQDSSTPYNFSPNFVDLIILSDLYRSKSREVTYKDVRRKMKNDDRGLI